jgi:hypothetical protein
MAEAFFAAGSRRQEPALIDVVLVSTFPLLSLHAPR